MKILGGLALVAIFSVASVAGAASSPLHVAASVLVGKHAAGLTAAAGSLWVTNDVDNTVTPVDLATDRAGSPLHLGGRGFPDPSNAISGDGSVWVVAKTTGTISRIDPGTSKVTATLTVPEIALGLALANGSLWATSFNPYRCAGNRCFSRLTRIDERSAKVTGRFAVPSASGIAAGFGSLWIVDHRGFALTRFDPRTRKTVARISVKVGGEGTFDGPERVAIGFGAVWVSQPSQDTVTRVDPRTSKVDARIHFPRGSTPDELAAGAGMLWVLGPKKIFRVDPGTNRITGSLAVGKHPGSDYRGLRSLVVVGHSLWVTDGDADTLDRIDLH